MTSIYAQYKNGTHFFGYVDANLIAELERRGYYINEVNKDEYEMTIIMVKI